MRTNYKVLFSIMALMLFAVLSSFSSIAQTTNDPKDDPDANACYEGGTLYDTCNSMDVDNDSDIDTDDIDWMWKCGYYLIRVEYGMYSADILDGICMEIIEVIEVEEEEEKKKRRRDDCEIPEFPALAAADSCCEAFPSGPAAFDPCSR
jgi:hypothetical protein